jgi:hypothetical protein
MLWGPTSISMAATTLEMSLIATLRDVKQANLTCTRLPSTVDARLYVLWTIRTPITKSSPSIVLGRDREPKNTEYVPDAPSGLPKSHTLNTITTNHAGHWDLLSITSISLSISTLDVVTPEHLSQYQSFVLNYSHSGL